MNNQLATGYIVCLSCGVILSVWFLFREIRTQRRWELAMAISSSISQIVPSIFTIVTLVITFNPSFQLDWVDLAVVCTLQAIVCTNLSRFLRSMGFPTWTTLLPHAASFAVVAVNVAFYYYKFDTHVLYPILLFVLATSSGLPVYSSYRLFRQHLYSGSQPNQRYLCFLGAICITNTCAALCELCGGLLLLVPQSAMPGNRLQNTIFLTCLSARLLCTLSFFTGTITRRIVRPIQALQATQRPDTGDTESVELMEHGGHVTTQE